MSGWRRQVRLPTAHGASQARHALHARGSRHARAHTYEAQPHALAVEQQRGLDAAAGAQRQARFGVHDVGHQPALSGEERVDGKRRVVEWLPPAAAPAAAQAVGN